MLGLMFTLAGIIGFVIVVIGPLWLILHYVDRWKTMNAKARETVDSEETAQLRAVADRLEARVASLEKLLDAEAAGWRDR